MACMGDQRLPTQSTGSGQANRREPRIKIEYTSVSDVSKTRTQGNTAHQEYTSDI